MAKVFVTAKAGDVQPRKQINTAPVLSYEEAQNDEVEALRSIFMEDFEEVEAKAAWGSKPVEKSFRLTLCAYSDKNVSLVLKVTLTSTYPKTLPILALEASNDVRDLPKMYRIITDISKSRVGEVMIYEIATAIQDVLEETATAIARNLEVPSLEHERTIRESEIRKSLLELEEVERKARETAAVEADEMMRLELNQAREELAEVQKKREVVRTESMMRRVIVGECLGAGKTSAVFKAYLTPPASSSVECFVLKQSILSVNYQKRRLLDLEDEMQRLKNIRHPNITSLLEFEITYEPEKCKVELLIEFANFSSLTEMLQVWDAMPLRKAKTACIDLLQALDFYHKNGIVHGRLHTGNVLLCHLSSGATVFKLADGGFQHLLTQLQAPNMLTSGGSTENHHDAAGFLRGPLWMCPEFEALDVAPTRRSDIWDFGVVMVQALFGLAVIEQYTSPMSFITTARLSEPFGDLLRKIFRVDPKRRLNAFEIIPFEFFRTNALTITDSASGESAHDSPAVIPTKSRRLVSSFKEDVLHGNQPATRYFSEWDEQMRLGRGGYGEVVRARNKLDNRIYAIKKITQKSQSELNQVLSEVHLLATLNHPYVVRYYTAWPEENTLNTEDTSHEVNSSKSFSVGGSSLNFGPSTGGLDFISSSGYPHIEFGTDSDSEAESEEDGLSSIEERSPAFQEPVSTAALTRRQSRSSVTFTLYIQMEYCEKLTLRDFIGKGLDKDTNKIMRLTRQIIEGLAHIHSLGIIHRDLKPENIFIDAEDNPKIGDFGLATVGQFQSLSAESDKRKHVTNDMTRSIGTTLYVAPELRSSADGSYNEKVDMYSLGLILFEMSQALQTGMERVKALESLREKKYTLPHDLKKKRPVLAELIESLLQHSPAQRPNSAAILASGILPIQAEDEAIRLAVKGISDVNSASYHKLLPALFYQPDNERMLRDQLWNTLNKHSPSVDYLVVQGQVQSRIISCFKRHGAVEREQPGLIPLSDYYNGKNVYRLLDASGILVQLPYDLTLPNARSIARQGHPSGKTYNFGTVYRAAAPRSEPYSGKEADFDIISHGTYSNLPLEEAEVIKVMDEILDEFPSLSALPICFHISHVDLLEMIVEFCGVESPQRRGVKEILGKLNVQNNTEHGKQFKTWQDVRLELRDSSISMSSASLEDMAQFDFRDSLEKCHVKLQSILKGTKYLPRLHEVFAHMNGLQEYLKRMGVRRKIYCSPLSGFNNEFYHGGVMFQCVFDSKKRALLAAGGRYDRLITNLRPQFAKSDNLENPHAVGMSIAWDIVVHNVMRYQQYDGNAFLKKVEEPQGQMQWATRRCDVLIACFDPSILFSAGVKLVTDLWSHDISAELAINMHSFEELITHDRNDKHSWIVIIKHEPGATDKPDLRVKNMNRQDDTDLRSSDLVSYLRSELRHRNIREGTRERARLNRQSSQPESSTYEKKSNVQVLMASHRNKKSHKWQVVEAAQRSVQELIRFTTEAPIASIETRDDVLEKIQETRLSEPDSWRKVIQAVPLTERQYIQEVQDMLEKFKAQSDNARRNCFIYNFRTDKSIYYDLLL